MTEKSEIVNTPSTEEVVADEFAENEDLIPQETGIKIAEMRHLLSLSDAFVSAEEKTTLRKEVTALCKKDEAVFFYRYTLGELADPGIIRELEAKNEVALKEFADTSASAAEAAKDSKNDFDANEFILKKVKYLVQIGDLKAFDVIEENFATCLTNTKLELTSLGAKLAFAYDDRTKWAAWADKLTKIAEKDGDWERRNRAAVYAGVEKLSHGQFSAASDLLAPVIRTYTCTELLSFTDFVALAALACLTGSSRQQLKTRVLDSSDAAQGLLELPRVRAVLDTCFECHYGDFMRAILALDLEVMRSRYLSAVQTKLQQQMILVAFRQYLISYRTVTLSAMANTFRVSAADLERRLGGYVSKGELSVSINAVDQTVEISTVIDKEAQYAELVKQSDLLLSKTTSLAQKLTTL